MLGYYLDRVVRACLDTICPKCGHRITPDKVVRVDWERQKCPASEEVFEAAGSRMSRSTRQDEDTA